jgi:penicillin-binding protein-related factor A (putative recombinase)
MDEQNKYKSKKTGDYYERLVNRLSDYYLKNDLGMLKKRFEPYARVSRTLSKNRFLAVNTGASGADFEIFLSDGRSGLIELKYRSSKMITLDALQAKQVEELALLNRWGFIGMVLVCLSPKGEEDQWFLVPIDAFTHSTKKSLNTTDLKRFYVPLIEQTDLPDLISKINALQLRNIE